MILSKFLIGQQHAGRLAQTTFRQGIRRSFVKSYAPARSPTVPLAIRIASGVAFSGGCAYNLFAHAPVALCKTQSTRVIRETDGIVDRKFKWLLFLRLLRPDWFVLLIAVISALLVAALNIQIPLHLGGVVTILTDSLNQNGSSFVDAVRPHAIKLLMLYGCQSLFTFVYLTSLSYVGENLSARLRQAVFESVIRQDLAYFDKTKTGEIMNTLSGDVQEFKSSFKQCIAQGLRSVAQTIGCACSLYSMNPKMTMLMFLVLPAIISIGTFLGAGLRKISARSQKQNSHAAGVADEAISNIRTVRAFAMEDTETELFRKEVDRAREESFLLGTGIGGFQALTNMALNGIVLGVLFVGGRLISEGEITTGNLMSFMVATNMIQKNLSQLFLLFGQYVKGLASGARVLDMIDMQATIPLGGGQTIPDGFFAGEIRLRNVTFAYPTRPNQVVLDNLTLTIPPGKSVALCGSSGSGKSTVASLIERFYDVDKGELLIDGVNVKDLDLAWLRGATIGFISQEPVLFATTIMENIRYGRPDATDDEVLEAARQANAHEFIMSFDDEYKTVLGERGVTISGGQKQRIAIARALVKNPQILILDEATSALDTQSEKIVQQTLDRVVKGRTVLVIAHRLSTIKNADMIYVMQRGRVVESGDHHTLTALKGAYWRLTQDDKQESKGSGDSKEFFRTGG